MPDMPIMSQAASDLGMGDELKQQMKDAQSMRKKKLMKQAQQMNAQPGMASNMLFPGGTQGYGNV